MTKDMKRTSYILILITAISALLLSSCAKETAVGTADGELVECTLQADVIGTGAGLDIDTKVALNADGVTPNWEEGDQILVLGADYKPVGTDGLFTLSSGQGTISGKFTGKVNVGQTAKYAIYPANAATVSGTSAVTTGKLLGATGDKTTGTIKAAVMLGSSTDGKNVTFSNACAVLKMNTGDYGKSGGDAAIKSIAVSASYGSTATPVAGAFNIDWTNLAITAASSGAENELTIELPSALQANAKDIYIPIFPLAKQGGTTAPSMKYVFTNTEDATAEVSYDFSDAIAGGVIKNLGTMQGMEFVAPGQPDNEIWYTTADGSLIDKSASADTYLSTFGANLVSNTYENGQGIMKFDGPVTKIGDYAFYDVMSDSEKEYRIYLPGLVQSIGSYAFALCYYMSYLYIPDSVTTVHSKFFKYNGAMYHPIYVETSKGIFEVRLDCDQIILGNGTVVSADWSCFSEGTLITMADGSKKPIEELEYDDEVRVWNFDEGCYDSAKILWITKRGLKVPFYTKCTFSDGSTLNVVGDLKTAHRLYNYSDRFFDHCYEIPLGKDIFTENGIVQLISREKVDKEVNYYNLITDKHINCFANGVLTSARYNNRWPIDENMKFVKDGRKIRPYREFRKVGISREWYEGMRLGEQTDSIARVKAYIDRCEKNARPRPETDQPGFFAKIWNWIKGLFRR